MVEEIPEPAGGRRSTWAGREPRGLSSPKATWDPSSSLPYVVADSWATLGQGASRGWGRATLQPGPEQQCHWTPESQSRTVPEVSL